MSKFAAITSSLLARKGEAQPWVHEALVHSGDAYEAQKPPRPAPPPRLASASPPPPSKDRSCSVRMSQQDYERLGILAVKRGVTRQVLMKEALAQLLVSQAKLYGCACMGACEKNCAD